MTFALGILGTFLLYRGPGAFIGRKIEKQNPTKSGLFNFTGRQIQENVLYQYMNLAVSSLLIVIALSCISIGVGNVAGHSAAEDRAVNFSVMGSEEDVMKLMNRPEVKKLIDVVYPLRPARVDSEAVAYNMSGLVTAIKKQPQTSLRDNYD